MRNEQLKYLTALLTIVTAGITFYVLAEKKGILFLGRDYLAAIGVLVSAYAAFFSVYLSRSLERKRRKNKRVFIIYSHKDKDKAKELTEFLRSKGYNPWLDEEEILPGQNWKKTIRQAIENSFVALYLCSENSQAKESGVSNEIKAAREVLRSEKEEHSPIIPILLEEVELPKELADIHAVKLYEKNGLEQLDKGLRYIINKST